MNYTLIGTGNMSGFIGKKFLEQGFVCKGVYGRNKDISGELATMLHTEMVNEIQALPETDCCIIAVTDRSIGEVAQKIPFKHATVVHTAGSVSLSVIPQEHKAALWPIYSISKADLPEHRNIPTVYEGSTDQAKATVRKLAYGISDIVKEVSWEQRQWLHLCAVLGNNFTNHLMAICEEICREQDLAFSLVRPIILQTFERVSDIEPTLVQTGPAVRKDHFTIENHLGLLKDHPAWQRLYETISASIEDMYQSRHK